MWMSLFALVGCVEKSEDTAEEVVDTSSESDTDSTTDTGSAGSNDTDSPQDTDDTENTIDSMILQIRRIPLILKMNQSQTRCILAVTIPIYVIPSDIYRFAIGDVSATSLTDQHGEQVIV